MDTVYCLIEPFQSLTRNTRTQVYQYKLSNYSKPFAVFGSAYNLCQPARSGFFVAKIKMINLPPSRLYRSLGDYDVLRGIFTEHIGTQSITQKALEAEARGDYSLALKLYNEVRSDKVKA